MYKLLYNIYTNSFGNNLSVAGPKNICAQMDRLSAIMEDSDKPMQILKICDSMKVKDKNFPHIYVKIIRDNLIFHIFLCLKLPYSITHTRPYTHIFFDIPIDMVNFYYFYFFFK